MTNSHIFDRAELLLGVETMSRLEKTRVIVFGVGGVGSWCAESLIRSGIGHLTIVDNDTVSPTNINRQLMAIPATIGRVKVEVLGEILKCINPEAEVECRNEIYSSATAANFHLDDYDYIIDCIDSLSDKALLIERATATRATLYSSMGAALKLDPTRIKVAEFWDVKGCPLARALRQRFKRSGMFPKKKFQCVYSDELLSNAGVADPSDSSQLESYGSTRKAGINGSLHHITSIFGITIAGLLIRNVSIKGK